MEINLTPHFNEKKLDISADMEVNVTIFRILKQLFLISIYSLKKSEVRSFLYEFLFGKVKKKFSKKSKIDNEIV